MFKKTTTAKTKTMIALLAASVAIPAVISSVPVEAATLSISDYVIKKNGQLYSLDVDTYIEMKAGGAAFLVGTSVNHISSSDGKIYLNTDYIEAKAAFGGNMNNALQALQQAGLSLNVEVGKVIVDSNGNITLQGPKDEAVNKEFQVVDIY